MKGQEKFTPSEFLEAEGRKVKSLAEAEKYRKAIDETIANLKETIPLSEWDKKISQAKGSWPLRKGFMDVIEKTITSNDMSVFTKTENGEMTVREFVHRLEEQRSELLGSN